MAFDDVAAATETVLPESAKALKRAPGELSNSRLALYALPSIPIAFLFLPVAMLMPAYYAREMHVSLSAIGGFLVISRMADVFLDPMIGRWSDNTHSKFGRRKLWMVIGTPILMLGAFILFMPMVPVNGWYLLIASFVIYAGGSTVGLPYAAWGTELMDTYHGRSRMAGFREAAGVVGGLLAACIPAITGLYGHGIDRFTMSIMGGAIIVLTPLMVFVAITFVKEPPVKSRVHVPLLPSLLALFKNKPFRLFCAAYIVYTIGASIPSATIVFFISDYLKAPNLVGPGLLLVALMTIIAVPMWLKVSRRFGKHIATAASLLISMALYVGVTPFLHPGDGWLYVGLLAIMGISSSGFVTLPMGLIGDIIDYDTLIHRQPRGGIYWGVWSFAQKVSPALAIGVTLPLLKYLGFQPGEQNTQTALDALKYVYCFGAGPFLLTAGILLAYFPIDARRHDIIRRRLEQRQKRAEKAAQ
ncbi:MAG: MFS transporter [Alphaproteobacteria bacterium]|nr:MFS transporter [Alphaproteobacteria bacterium]